MRNLKFILLSLLLFPACSTVGKFVRPLQDVQTVSTNSVGTIQTNTVTIVAPEWFQTLSNIEATGALVPPPYGTWVSLGAAGLGALLAAWARNKQRNAEDVASTIIRGIETIADPTTANTAKAAVSNVATIKGNNALVHTAVKAVTK